MVGGVVIEVLQAADKIWINVQDRQHAQDICAINLENNNISKKIQIGDQLWWQGNSAFWTPIENRLPEEDSDNLRCGVDFDIKIPRLGYSGANHPAKNMIDVAYEVK